MEVPKAVRGFLVDITGVLYNSCKGTDGIVINKSAEAVKMLYEHSKVKFLSNESTHTTESVVARLGRLGIEVRIEDIITPAPLAAKLMKKSGFVPHVLVHHGVRTYFDDFEGNPNCVLLGEAESSLSYEKLNCAFRKLMDMQDPTLITLGNGKFYQRTDGPCLDVGAFAKALIYASNCKHIVVGKPTKSYFSSALEQLGISADEAVMIGDDIISDVGGAQQCGIRGVQLRSGKWRPEWENHGSVKPDLVADTLYDAVKTIFDNGFML